MKNRLFCTPKALTAFNKVYVVFFSSFLQVTYCVNGFVDKNNDLLYRDLSQCMYSCGHPLAKKLFPEGSGLVSYCCCIAC